MSRSINQLALQEQTAAYCGTCGESAVATTQNFLPAFQNTTNGEVALSRLKTGNPAPMHLLSYLPIHWAASVDSNGLVTELQPGIVAGFVRDNRFYSRAEAAEANKLK